MLFLHQFKPSFPLITRGYGVSIDADPYAVEIGYNRLPPGFKQRFRRDIYILHYIASGNGTFLGKPFEKGDGYLVVPNELDIVASDEQEPCEYYWIMFHGSRAKNLLQNGNLLPHNGIFHISQAEKCVEIIKNALYSQYNNSFEEANAIQAVLFQLIAIHASDQGKISANSNSLAKNIANYINSNYYNPLRIDDIAKNFYITRSYMYTIFKREMGISPKEYLIEQRIEKAKLLLISDVNKMTIKEISYAVGFTDPLYFANVFHARTGQTPSEYRKSTGNIKNLERH